ncbi:MAG: hypothetical protein L0Y74_08105 [candidate division Zixibacteria bacterium]|nr:hypothetical protein [candidate division Zixibacteria bacterium]
MPEKHDTKMLFTPTETLDHYQTAGFSVVCDPPEKPGQKLKPKAFTCGKARADYLSTEFPENFKVLGPVKEEKKE